MGVLGSTLTEGGKSTHTGGGPGLRLMNETLRAAPREAVCFASQCWVLCTRCRTISIRRFFCRPDSD